MLVHSKMAYLFLPVCPGTEYTRALIWKKGLLHCFESYQGMVYPVLPYRQSRQRMVNTLLMYLTLSWRRPISHRNQSFDLLRKSMDWFLYDIDLRHERVKRLIWVVNLFLFYVRKNIEIWLVFQQTGNTLNRH